MKLFLEIIMSLILHPIAVLLAWINLSGRTDQTSSEKIIWALICLIWGFGPILYILVGKGKLW